MKIKCTAPVSMHDHLGHLSYAAAVDEVLDLPEDHALRWIRRNKAVEYVEPIVEESTEKSAAGKRTK